MREHSSWGDIQYRIMNHAGRSHGLDWYFAHLGGLRQANASHREHSVCRYAGGRPSHHRTTAVGLLKMCAKHEYIYYIWLRKTLVFRDMHTFIYAMSCVVLSVCIHDDVRLCVVKFTCFQSYSILQRASVVCHCGKLVATSKLYWFTSQFFFYHLSRLLWCSTKWCWILWGSHHWAHELWALSSQLCRSSLPS